ncbi:MAG: serine hydroxymethyltransferase, partial [Candidatus Pacebacteria bacterium]|nr:serine hydroxymethyltransferase [Candidatus Paceibacterota bacterium]
HHLHRIPALYGALREMQEFGKDYAGQIVKNAQALAKELAEYGFDILGKSKGFTQSHQIVVNCGEPGSGHIAAEKLERANIILNKNIIPGDGQSPKNPRGIRIGVQEMTRFGMKEEEMEKIGEFIKKVILDNKDPEEIGKEVADFRKNYQKIHYCAK